MKTIDRTKAVVLGIGIVTVVASLVGVISTMSVMNFLFPLYIGMSLLGLTLLHKEEHLQCRTQSN